MDLSHPASDPSSQPSSSSQPSTKPLRPPPLPPHHLTDLVPHLLPPLAPLPAHLLSTPLIQRLTYLPPSPNDLDAHLSPLPSDPSQPITHALNSLAHGYTMDPTEYTTDGESVFARRVVRPVGGGYGGTADIAELRWLYEDKDERGWGFYGVHLPGPEEQDLADSGRGLKWASRVPDIPSHEAPAAEDYWAGFSSSSDSPVEDDEHAPHDTQAEDDYWARYSAGAPSAQPSTRPTPAQSRRQSRLNASANATTSDVEAGATTDIDATGPGPSSLTHLDAKGLAETISAAVGQAPGTIHIDENTVKRVTDVLATLHPSLASSWAEPSPWQGASSSQHAEEKLQATKGRLRMKLGSLLRAAWLTYLGNVTMDDEIEEKAMRWLRLGREVASASSSTQLIGDEGVGVGAEVNNVDLSEAVARAKMETLKEMWAAAEDDHPSDEFYRAVEQALKASRPEMRDRRYSAEQQSYWES